ncbi:MAG: hypothetical protein ACKPKO_45195 [Candidatus Fonsibacter sp.]
MSLYNNKRYYKLYLIKYTHTRLMNLQSDLNVKNHMHEISYTISIHCPTCCGFSVLKFHTEKIATA